MMIYKLDAIEQGVLMGANTHTEAHLNDLIADAAYEAVKQSELFETLRNAEVDAKAEELAAHLRRTIEEWLNAQQEAVRLWVK